MNPTQKTPAPRSNLAPLIGDRAMLRVPEPMNQIAPGIKHHQRNHQGQADPKAVFLNPLAERLPAKRFGRVEQEMSTVKDRNWKQVDKSKIDRQEGH